MRPPWLTNVFSTDLSLDGLSLYTRPTFLQWSAAIVQQTFGKAIAKTFRDMATGVSLTWVGVVARPLYVCTARKPDGQGQCCMRLASMSPLLQFPEEHREWLCTKCRRFASASGSAPTPRRLLKLYPLVEVQDGHSTPLKSGHIAALVHPPPASFSWPEDKSETAPSVDEPTPSKSMHERKITFGYEQAASDVIWCSAMFFA